MAICKNCGCFTKDTQDVCPQCGAPREKTAPVRPKPEREYSEEEQAILDWQPVVSEGTPEEPKKPKKNKAPKPKKPRKKVSALTKVLLALALVVLLGLGGVAGYRYFTSDRTPQYNTFDCSCGEFTAELNRLLAADNSTQLQLDESKWAQSTPKGSFEYIGGGFTLRAKTANEEDMFSKMRELRVGPSDTEEGVRIVSLSIVALEKEQTQQAVMNDMAAVKAQQKDKTSYRKVAFTYDRDKDEFVLVPSSGAKSAENHGATADQAQAADLIGTFVSGDRFVKAGDKYLFNTGKTIFYRTAVNGDNIKVVDVDSDGTLLTNGSTVYYVVDNGNGHEVCSVRLDGSDNQMLFAIAGDVTLLHVNKGWLYYVRAGLTSSGGDSFCKFNLETKEHKRFTEVPFAAHRTVVEGNRMYCSRNAVSATDIENIHAFCFNFDTEKFTEALTNCLVSPHGYFNGAGKLCLDSHRVDEEGYTFSDHYLYTDTDGELKQSPEITVNASLLLASPATDDTILFDNANQEYYWFDRKTGDTKKLTVPEMSSFTFDAAHPEQLFCCVTEAKGESRTLTKLYALVNGALEERFIDGGTAAVGVNPVIADGYLLDTACAAHAISSEKTKTAATTPAASAAPAGTAAASAAGDYNAYLGTWSDNGENVSHFVTVTAVAGNRATFDVSSVYFHLEQEASAKGLTGEIVDGKLDFTYTDSAGNTGKGTLTFGDGLIHATIISNNDGGNVGINADADLASHTPPES